MENIRYHRADRKDIETLIGLRMNYMTALTGIDSPEKVREVKESLKGYFEKAVEKREGSCWYIASENDKAVGIGGLVFREQPGNFKNPSGRVGYIMTMFTLPEFRRKGICSAILKALIKEAMEIGVTTFELHATKEGEFVYKQLGFQMRNEPSYRMHMK